jgi:hypothetical protein
MAHKIL